MSDNLEEKNDENNTTNNTSKNSRPVSEMQASFSPEKVVPKRLKQDSSSANERPECSSRPLPINIASEKKSTDSTFPLWVAGASPAKFMPMEDIIKMNSSLEKMALVHEISINKDFTVEDLQRKDTIYEAIKSNIHKAYWDVLKEDLTKDPPDYEHAFSLLGDLKKLITDHLTTGKLTNALTAINDILDLDRFRMQFEKKLMDFQEILQLVLVVLEKLCAPVRDNFVRSLKHEKDLVLLFKGVFELVEHMKIDMANFALSQNRSTIEHFSSEYEREEFMKIIKFEKENAIISTKYWLKKLLNGYLAQKFPNYLTNSSVLPLKLSSSDHSEILIQFYLEMLQLPLLKPHPGCPETLKLDELRILALGEKFMQLIITTASIFITGNLAGKIVCENGDFKTVLKNELISILNDVSFSNYEDKLENVFLQCEKNVMQKSESRWNNSKSDILKKQIYDLKSKDDAIRNIAKNRICDFLHQVMSRSSVPLRLPPGLSVIQSELAAFTSKYYVIVLHNWNTFGVFYFQILDEMFTEIRSKPNESSSELPESSK